MTPITACAVFLMIFTAVIVVIGLTTTIGSLVDRTQKIFHDEHEEASGCDSITDVWPPRSGRL